MRIPTLAATAAAVAVTAAAGARATAPQVTSHWYQQLRKPAYQPPRQVFPVVWPALYADIAVVSASTLYRLGSTGQDRQRRCYQVALIINLALNASWSWLFFNRRRFATATVLSAGLTASSADLAYRATTARGAAALPLVLYPLWCTFATVLCGHISLLNSGRRASPTRRHISTPAGFAHDCGGCRARRTVAGIGPASMMVDSLSQVSG